MIHGVIMSGGSGTRLWPLSRRAQPKQFLALSGERSLLQQASDRILPLVTIERQWVVTNALQETLTAEHLPDLPDRQLLIEPCGRNTAPCIGLAAVHLLAQDPDAVMVVMPADHLIAPEVEFQNSLQHAFEIVADDPGRLVLFGVPPHYPATGFGYIHRGAPLSSGNGFEVQGFREKPDRDTAAQYLQEGDYFWNCGLFVWRADRILDTLKQHEPELHAGLMQIRSTLGTQQEGAVLEDEFRRMKSISIDYAVLEREASVVVVEASFSWDDIGSFTSLQRLHGSDADGNTCIGKSVLDATTNCIVRADGERLIAMSGIENLIVIQTPSATLIAPRDDEAALRRLVQLIEDQGLAEYL